jgi:hypothetical protein
MDSIVDWWQKFWQHASFWNAFWPAVWGALVGAVTAFLLEPRYRRVERIRIEVGHCNRLLFTLVQMLTVLEDLKEQLFEEPRERLGHVPEWNEIGGMAGARDCGPEFIVGEYTFLLEDRNTKSRAPELLGRIYTVHRNFKATLDHLRERTQLWYEYCERRSATAFSHGAEALQGMVLASAPATRIKEFTQWLEKDLSEEIPNLKRLIPDMKEVLRVQYPNRRFIE